MMLLKYNQINFEQEAISLLNGTLGFRLENGQVKNLVVFIYSH